MTDREVMKMALDDLVTLVDDLRRIPSDIAQTIAALRTALAQPEQSKYSDLISDGGLDPRNKFDAQQEPVAWLVSDAQGRYATIRDPAPYGEEVYEPLYAAPPKREWVGLTAIDIHVLKMNHDKVKVVYTDHAKDLSVLGQDVDVNSLINTIETILKAKNNAV